MLSEPKTIYLSVACNLDSEHGRFWSENGDGPECCCGKSCTPVKYVLAAREEGRQSSGERVGDPKTIREDVFHTVRRAIRNEVVAGDYGKLLGVDQAANFAADEVMALLSPQAAPVEQGEAAGPRLINAPSSDEPIRCPDCNALIHDWVHGLEHVCGVGDPRDPANEQKDGAS